MIDFKDIDNFLKNASIDEINELSQLVIDNSSNDSIDESFKFAQDICDEFLSNGFVLDDNDIDTIVELSILINKSADIKKLTYIDYLDNFYQPTTITQKVYDKETNDYVNTETTVVEDVKFKNLFNKLTDKYNSIIEKYSNTDALEKTKEDISNDLQILTIDAKQIQSDQNLKNKFLSIAEKYKKINPNLNITLEQDKQKFELNYFESIFNSFFNDVDDGLASVSNMLNAIEGKYFYKDYAVINLMDNTNSYGANFVISGLCDYDDKGNEIWDFSNFTISEAWGDKQLIKNFIDYLDRSYKEDGVIPYIQNNNDTYVSPTTSERYNVEILDPEEKNKFYGKNKFSDGNDSDGNDSFDYYSISLKYEDGENYDQSKNDEESFARADLLRPKKVKHKTKLVSSNFFKDIEKEVDKEKLKKYRSSLEKKKNQLRSIKRNLIEPFKNVNKRYKSDSSSKILNRINNNEYGEKLVHLYKKALEKAGVGTDVESLFDLSSSNDKRDYVNYPIIEEIYNAYENIDENYEKDLDTKGGMVESLKTIQADLVSFLEDSNLYLNSRIKNFPQFVSKISENYKKVYSGFENYSSNYDKYKSLYEKYRDDIDKEDIKLQTKKRRNESDAADNNSYSKAQNEILSIAKSTVNYINEFGKILHGSVEDVKDLKKIFQLGELDYDKKYIVKVIGDMHDPTYDDPEFNISVDEILKGDINEEDYSAPQERKDTSIATTYFAILAVFSKNIKSLKSDLERHIKTPRTQDSDKGYKKIKHETTEEGMTSLRDLQGGHPSQEHEDLMQESRKNMGILNDLATKRKELENLLTDDLDDDTKEEINNQIVELDALQEQYSNRNKEISSKLQDMLPKQESPFTGQNYDAYKSEKEKGLYVPKKK